MNRAEAMRLAADALADWSPVEALNGDLIVSVSDNDPGDDDPVPAEILDALADIGPGYSVDWTGDGNCDADGEQTSDVRVKWDGDEGEDE